MTGDTLNARDLRISLDPAPTGHIILVAVTDSLDSFALRFTPAQAARLAHRLLDMASRLESP